MELKASWFKRFGRFLILMISAHLLGLFFYFWKLPFWDFQSSFFQAVFGWSSIFLFLTFAAVPVFYEFVYSWVFLIRLDGQKFFLKTIFGVYQIPWEDIREIQRSGEIVFLKTFGQASSEIFFDSSWLSSRDQIQLWSYLKENRSSLIFD